MIVVYDFNIRRYFDDNKHLTTMVNYYRNSLNMSKKNLQKDNSISHATYRRAEVTNFVGHIEILQTLARYFKIPIQIEDDIIDELNTNFNLLYTYLYLNDLDKMEYYYQKIEVKKELYDKSILLSIYHFARLVYYVGSYKRVEIKIISESLDFLKVMKGEMLDVFEFLLEDYIFCYYALTHNEESSVKYAKKVYLEAIKYPELLPQVLYQMSLNYYFINDYANSIFYSFEALPKLEHDLNYSRALHCNLNIAICFERLNNTIKSKEILNKIFLYLMTYKVPRVEYLANLTLANCYVTEENYKSAIKIFKDLEDGRDIKGENSLMLLYCYYKIKENDSFISLINCLTEDFNNNKFYQGYYDVAVLLNTMVENKKKEIMNQFKHAEKSFQFIGDSKIVDIIISEMKDRKYLPNNSQKNMIYSY